VSHEKKLLLPCQCKADAVAMEKTLNGWKFFFQGKEILVNQAYVRHTRYGGFVLRMPQVRIALLTTVLKQGMSHEAFNDFAARLS